MYSPRPLVVTEGRGLPEPSRAVKMISFCTAGLLILIAKITKGCGPLAQDFFSEHILYFKVALLFRIIDTIWNTVISRGTLLHKVSKVCKGYIKL